MACLRRVDCLLFYKLLAQGRELEFDNTGYISNSVIRFLDATFDGRIASVPRLDETAVMCERGALTFQSGVALKLAVTRWSEWAFEMDIKEYGTEGAGELTGGVALWRAATVGQRTAGLLQGRVLRTITAPQATTVLQRIIGLLQYRTA